MSEEGICYVGCMKATAQDSHLLIQISPLMFLFVVARISLHTNKKVKQRRHHMLRHLRCQIWALARRADEGWIHQRTQSINAGWSRWMYEGGVLLYAATFSFSRSTRLLSGELLLSVSWEKAASLCCSSCPHPVLSFTHNVKRSKHSSRHSTSAFSCFIPDSNVQRKCGLTCWHVVYECESLCWLVSCTLLPSSVTSVHVRQTLKPPAKCSWILTEVDESFSLLAAEADGVVKHLRSIKTSPDLFMSHTCTGNDSRCTCCLEKSTHWSWSNTAT